MTGLSVLSERLDGLTREGDLYEALPAKRVRCRACAHRCVIPPGRRGVCRVRFNREGRLFVPWGYSAGVAVGPVEKKPFFHMLPGSQVLTFGMLGCNFHCAYCQNWITSQALRDPAAGWAVEEISPEALVAAAREFGAEGVASSYNEPLITAEWAAAVFREAKAAGLRTAMVSNGYGTAEVLEYLRPWCDALKVDLKTVRDPQYRRLGGRVDPVLETVRLAQEMGL